MTPREIIAEAWAITQRERPLHRWGFFSSFFETLLNLKLIGYQIYFLHASLIGKEVGFFDDFIWLYYRVPFWLFLTIMITFGLLLVTEFIVPHLAKGAIIGLTAKSFKKEELKGGLILALNNFFPMLGTHELFILSGWATALTAVSVTLRYIDGDVKWFIVSCVIGVWTISNILKFMASFAEPAIVVNRMHVFEAIGKSFKLIVSHLGHVMFLWVLLMVISVRILINTALVILLPGIVVGIALLLANILSPIVSYLIAGGVGAILVFIASYYFAYIHVFKEAVWTLTYFELKKQKDFLVIE